MGRVTEHPSSASLSALASQFTSRARAPMVHLDAKRAGGGLESRLIAVDQIAQQRAMREMPSPAGGLLRPRKPSMPGAH